MRYSEINRKTKETEIKMKIYVDGTGQFEVDTGIGFFDHMLKTFAVHSDFDIKLVCDGDLEVDTHHTIEDVGIVLGQGFKEALDDKDKIMRYGTASIPMDETLATCVLDIASRTYLHFDAEFKADRIGDLDTESIKEFFRAFSSNSGLTLHLAVPYGENDHHKCEALFKAFAHAVKQAVKEDSTHILSSKGSL